MGYEDVTSQSNQFQFVFSSQRQRLSTLQSLSSLRGNMKNAVLCLSASTVLLLTVACSKVKTVTVLAEQWETGQHRTCMYGHEKLYCFKPDEIPSLQPPFTPYTVESHRA